MTNRYSPTWYTTFLETISRESTRLEVDFVARLMPPARFPQLLDLCCGSGRHSGLLAHEGYTTLGLDANPQAIARAREAYPHASFLVGDMRALHTLQQTFDAVVNLWHSFGYFDDATNQHVLRQVHHALRPGGRAVFDIYNREHFLQRPDVETGERHGKVVHTIRTWQGLRQRVALSYDGRLLDTFEWRLYTPAEFQSACAAAGFKVLLSCAWFDEAQPPAPQHARMQFVLERPR